MCTQEPSLWRGRGEKEMFRMIMGTGFSPVGTKESHVNGSKEVQTRLHFCSYFKHAGLGHTSRHEPRMKHLAYNEWLTRTPTLRHVFFTPNNVNVYTLKKIHNVHQFNTIYWEQIWILLLIIWKIVCKLPPFSSTEFPKIFFYFCLFI